MRTSQAAERAGVNVQTLRYYERRGILPPPQRQESGYRAYGADSVQAVRFIKRAQGSDSRSLIQSLATGNQRRRVGR